MAGSRSASRRRQRLVWKISPARMSATIRSTDASNAALAQGGCEALVEFARAVFAGVIVLSVAAELYKAK